jgi:hypothetical protein
MLYFTPKMGHWATQSATSKSRRMLTFSLVGAAIALGCESGNHGKDASPVASQRMAQVSVRFDMPNGGAPSLSLLAFRAEATDVATSDVLGAVDPLVAPAPESACELRDVGGTARTVRAQGGFVNLQELSGVSLSAGAHPPVHAAPRVYPPLADVVSGVIAEAGPLDLAEVPDSIDLAVPTQGGDTAVRLGLPQALSVSDGNDKPLDAATPVSMKGDLVLRVAGPSRAFLEIRPFGAPSAIACAVTSGGWVVVPHDLLVKLVATAGRASVSFEAVWRETRLVSAGGGEVVRLAFEARSSTVLELRP